MLIPYTQKWFVQKMTVFSQTVQRRGKRWRTIKHELLEALSTWFHKMSENKVAVYKDNDVNGQWTLVVKHRKNKEIRFDLYFNDDGTCYSIRRLILDNKKNTFINLDYHPATD